MNLLKKLSIGNTFYFFCALAAFFFLFIPVFAVFTGNSAQEYYDVIIEYTADSQTNKSAEMFLIYFLSFFGIAAYTVFFFLTKNKNFQSGNKTADIPLYIVSALGAAALFKLFFQSGSLLLSCLFIYALIIYARCREKLTQGLILFLFSLYFFYSLCRICCCFGANIPAAGIFCIYSAFLTALLIMKKNININRIILIEQLFLPFLLLIYTAGRHIGGGIIVSDAAPLKIQVLIYAAIALFFFEALFVLKKNFRAEPSLNNIISLGACASIMGFNLFSSEGNIPPSDMHHPFENIIGFHQIFQMGVNPIDGYIPISGFYSIIHGAVFHFFSGGDISYYSISENMFYLIIAFVIVLLLSFRVNKTILFFISVLYSFAHPLIHSDRIIFVLPFMLILSMPELIKKQNLWMKLYFLFCLFYSLYYPLFGAAFALGFFPFFLYQLKDFIKSNEFAELKTKAHFYINWGLCLIPAVLAAPLLKVLASHVKIMSSQTLWADGLARFSQAFGSSLFPYIDGNNPVKQIFIYILTFSIPALFVCAAYILSLKLLKNSVKTACLALSIPIFTLVSFSYTALRLDVNSIYSRSAMVLTAGAAMAAVYALAYLKDSSHKAQIICFMLMITLISPSWGFLRNNEKLKSFYFIPFYYINHESGRLKKLDSRFNFGISLEDAAIDKTKTYYGFSQFAYYYLYGLKGASVLEPYTVKGFDAANETIDNIQRNKALVYLDLNSYTNYYLSDKQYSEGFKMPGLNSYTNYYLYNYLMTSGKYVWNKKDRMFYPSDGTLTLEQISEINNSADTAALENFDAGRTAGSLGLSMKTLYPVFSKPDVKYTADIKNKSVNISFDKELYGNDADFVYLEFSGFNNEEICGSHINGSVYYCEKEPAGILKYFMKRYYNAGVKIKISWLDNEGKQHSMQADAGQGRLLAALGAGAEWLLNNHREITITVLKNDEIIDIPEIKKIEFLKLRKAG